MFLTSTPKKAVLSQTNSIECLICAEVLETSDRIAVLGCSQWDLRGTLCKILGGELRIQFSNEDLQYVCKRKCYPKLRGEPREAKETANDLGRLRIRLLYKLQARNVIAVLTCPFQLHTEEKALLCDWKGHVVNLPI